MSSHRPKTAALLAHSEGLLSAEGSRRLQRHLNACETCQRELAAIELYEQMVDDARTLPTPPVEYDTMELALGREAQRISTEIHARRRRRAWFPIAGLAAAAAALLAMWIAWPHPFDPMGIYRAPAPDERSTHSHSEEEPALPEPAATASQLEPVVTLVAAPAHLIGSEDGEEPTPLSPGEVLSEDARLRVGDGGEVHVRMRDGVGMVALAGTALSLTEAREDRIRVTLEQGRLAQSVAPLSSGSSYVVLVAGYEVEGDGARFVVSYVEGVVGIDLLEGTLDVRPPAGDPFELAAPARWRSDGSTVDGEPEAPDPREPVAGDGPRVGLTLRDARIARWEIDGAVIEGLGDVRLRVAPGEHEIRAWDLRNRLYVGLVPVHADPVTIGPEALQPQGPVLRAGHLEERAIAAVLQRGRRQIQRCYEVSLRRGATVGGRIRLRVTVGLLGEVHRAQVLGLEGQGAAELAECIGNYASRWTFPPPGGPVTFEVPLNLTAR